MAQRTIPAKDLADFFDTARSRRLYFEAAGCRYWVFEQGTDPATILEFAEGPDARTLGAALLGQATEAFEGPIFTEVETR